MAASEKALRPLPGNLRLAQLPVELPLKNDESISTVASYKSSIYIGTSKGQILHLHCFEDASDYMLILQLQVTEKDVSVTKIMPLPDVELCLVVCNRTLYVYTLPELSPCHVGKIRDVNDISELSQVKNPKTKNIHDKVIVFTSTKLRVVQFIPPETVKLLRDIPYTGALMGVSSAAGTSANYSNICLVANGENYDVVDLQQTRRISLFEHNPEKTPQIRPNILPFDAEGKEEYLLSVRTNESMSMAMFINSFGDVTRGTLTWIDLGYPTNGMAVVWPYLLGLFHFQDTLSLTFSSLETLEVVESFKMAEVFEDRALGEIKNLKIQRLAEPIYYSHSELSSWLQKVDIDAAGQRYVSLQPANVVLHNETSLFYMYQESSTSMKLQNLLEGLKDKETDWESQLEALKDEAGVLRLLHIILLLVTSKFDLFNEASKVDFDPRIFIYLIEDLDKEVYEGLLLEKAVWTVLDHFRVLEVPGDFKDAFIKSTFENSTVDSKLFGALRVLIYRNLTDLKSTFDMIDSEAEIWVSGHASNSTILQGFDDKGWHLVKIHLQLLQQEKEKDPSVVDSTANEITNIAFKLLDKRVEEEGVSISDEGIATKDNVSLDLVDIILTQLKEKFEDSELYNKKLLELLKLHPQRGLTFLESNKNGKHKATHRHILEEYSKLHDLDAGFSSLKLEFIEQSLFEHIKEKKEIDLKSVRELVDEQLEFLQSQNESFEEEYVNLEILFASFKLENDLAEGHSARINWIDYLGIHGPRSECKTLVSIYTTLYELFICLCLHQEELPSLSFGTNQAMVYLNSLFHETDRAKLLDECINNADHTTAYWLAIHEQPPFPRELSYVKSLAHSLKTNYKTRPEDDIKSSMKQILDTYLQFEKKLSRHEGMKRLVTVFGKYFSPPELLKLMPSDLPIAFLYEYLTDILVDEEANRIDSDMVKTFARLDSRLTGKVYANFHATYKSYLEEDAESGES
ncbi:hypothetical protein FT663_01902 [Candidozyma haemuli var. vulneris]|nr:hypothetical protein FT662_02027 [[Candida] haemuloni var. vulneris]KAF3993398.1 hypothetical protein FT663_01902 [[Candida] haemuloni var. vulneris]